MIQSISLNHQRGHQIYLKRIIIFWLHVDLLPVTRFLIPENLTHENGDCTIEVFLLIAALKLSSSFGLVFQGFGEEVGEDLKPSGAISVT